MKKVLKVLAIFAAGNAILLLAALFCPALLGGAGISFAMAEPIDNSVTTEVINAVDGELFLSEVERKVTETSPDRFPVGTLLNYSTRKIGLIKSGKYRWRVRERLPLVDKVAAAVTPTLGLTNIKVENIGYYANHQTIGVRSSTILGADGTELALFVVKIDKPTSTLSVIALNGVASGNKTALPTIPAGTLLSLGSTGKSELDWSSDNPHATADRLENYLQMFMREAEISEYADEHKRESDIYTLEDLNRDTVYDVRTDIEYALLFGCGVEEIYDPVANNNKSFCNGLIRYKGVKRLTTTPTWNKAQFVDLMKDLFTGSNGSRHKRFVAGGDLMADIQKHVAIQDYRDQSKIGSLATVEYNLQLNRINAGWGTLDIIYAPLFDEWGREKFGVCIDEANWAKATWKPFEIVDEDNRPARRNSKSKIIRETSCPVFYMPNYFAVVNL